MARTIAAFAWVSLCAATTAPAPPVPAPSGASHPAGGPVAPSSRTVIHPGDQLAVQVYGDQTLTQNTMVLQDGTIDYPLVGRVPVGGKTPSQAAALLASRLHEFIRHPVVTIAIAQLGQPNVLVLGDVKTPGKYQLRSDAKVTDAIAAAGGLATTNGAFPEARVADPNGTVRTISLEALLQRGDTAQDMQLSEGSVVYVPGPVQFTVDVAGAVDHPGDIQVNEGDHLSVAIAKAGDSQNAQSDLNHVRVVRTGADGKQTTMEVNLYDALKNGNWTSDVALQKGDVIYVPQASKHTDFFTGLGTGLLYLFTHFIP